MQLTDSLKHYLHRQPLAPKLRSSFNFVEGMDNENLLSERQERLLTQLGQVNMQLQAQDALLQLFRGEPSRLLEGFLAQHPAADAGIRLQTIKRLATIAGHTLSAEQLTGLSGEHRWVQRIQASESLEQSAGTHTVF